MTVTTPVALNPRLAAPALYMGRLTMRTGQTLLGPSIDPVSGIIACLAAEQPMLQLISLPIRQLAKLVQPATE